jgi:hypothetical protein
MNSDITHLFEYSAGKCLDSLGTIFIIKFILSFYPSQTAEKNISYRGCHSKTALDRTYFFTATIHNYSSSRFYETGVDEFGFLKN